MGVCFIEAKASNARRKSYILRILYTVGDEVKRHVSWRPDSNDMFTVYIDDSGISPDQHIAIAAAWMIPDKQNGSNRPHRL
jgi:hypothetical protein